MVRRFAQSVFAVFALCALPLFAGVHLPESSPEQLNATPLSRGQVVWHDEGLYATIYVGGDGGKTLMVRDSAALRGYTPTKFAPDRFAILPTGDFTVTNNTYTLAPGLKTGTIEIVVADGTPIHKVNFHFTDYWILGMPHRATNSIHVAGNRATVTMISGSAKDEFRFEGLEYLPPGQSADIKNGVETIIPFQFYDYHNKIAAVDLHKLPHFLLHYWDYNRGEHWANYPATNDVMMGKHPIRWSTYEFGEFDGNFEFNWHGLPYLQFLPGESNNVSDGWTLDFTDIRTDDAAGLVHLEWRITAPPGETIHTNQFTVCHAPHLPLNNEKSRRINETSPFRAIPSDIVSVTGSGQSLVMRVSVEKIEGDESGFYRVYYIPDPDAQRAKFHVAVETPALILPDSVTGRRYRVTIANGQFSFTQLED